jgi:hypothetical protein
VLCGGETWGEEDKAKEKKRKIKSQQTKEKV